MSLQQADVAALDQLHAELLARVAAGRIEVPILPQTAAEVLAVCKDASCDARKLADLIQRDGPLTGHVLSIANSAAYAPREPIVSLAQAISRLGFDVVCDISMAVALKRKVFTLRGNENRVRVLWTHSALTAAWAKEIARTRRKSVEGAFLCGLLHDVGKAAVFQASLDLFEEHGLRADGIALDSWALDLHAPVGATILERWNFPRWMAAAIRGHHDPALAGEHTEHARTTQMADMLAHASLHPDAETDAALALHPALSELGIYADEFEPLLKRRAQVLELARAFH
jgi:putative nucleotidyltransferase with HDIG domain